MAVSSSFVQRWIAAEGPWAYHVCPSASVAACVLGEGLAAGRLTTHVDELASRPGHVYLTVGRAYALVADQSFAVSRRVAAERAPQLASQTVAVDLRGLDPSAIVPDEDCCFESNLVCEAGVEPLVCPVAGDPGGLVCDPLAHPGSEQAPYASYGQWAQARQLGGDVAHSERCWQQVGSLAYGESVAPQLLRAVSAQECRELLLG